MLKNDILRRLQKEGLAIIELHEKLNELNIKHTFVDRKQKQITMIKKEDTGLKREELINAINDMTPFDYQITLKENGNRISLIQSPYSYGVTNNIIEVYNFQHEPIILTCNAAVDLIRNKKINERIIKINEEL
jgi:hypothetical protein